MISYTQIRKKLTDLLSMDFKSWNILCSFQICFLHKISQAKYSIESSILSAVCWCSNSYSSTTLTLLITIFRFWLLSKSKRWKLSNSRAPNCRQSVYWKPKVKRKQKEIPTNGKSGVVVRQKFWIYGSPCYKKLISML